MTSAPLHAPLNLQKALRTVAKSIPISTSPVIFRQGEAARGVYLVESGSVKLSLRGDNDEPLFERLLGSGSLLGLPATINNVPYTATATAVQDSELAFISRESLLQLMMGDPKLAMTILQLLSQEIHSMREVIVGKQPVQRPISKSRGRSAD